MSITNQLLTPRADASRPRRYNDKSQWGHGHETVSEEAEVVSVYVIGPSECLIVRMCLPVSG